MRIKVLRCGLCGTDLEEYKHGPIVVPVEKPHPLTGRTAPVTLGHEVVGEVVDVGGGVDFLKPGDRVVPDGLYFCGSCRYCREHRYNLCGSMASIGQQADGGLAEYMTVPAAMCVPVDRSVPADVAALAEPLAVSLRAVNRSGMRLGSRVAIVGAGTIGLCVLALAKMRGASLAAVFDARESRLERAKRAGADVAGKADEAGGSYDVVFECAGHPGAFALGLDLLAPGGTLVVIGATVKDVPVNPLRLTLREQTIVTSLSHVYFEDTKGAVELLESGRLDLSHVVTSVVPLRDVVRVFETLIGPDHDEVKVLIDATA